MESSRTRLGMVGCGVFGHRHAEALRELSDRVDVVAVADPDPDRAAEVADIVGADAVVTDHRALLGQVDAITIATPHQFHHPVAADAIAAGVHVFLEKPLAMTEAEGLSLVAAAETAGTVLMVGYPLRYHPLMVRLKQEVDSGRWGEPIHASLVTEQYLVIPDGHWRATTAGRGGGGMFSHGCHYIDLLLWILGEPVRGAHLGTTHGTPWQVEGETTSHAIIEFAGGRLGHHFGTEVANRPPGASHHTVHLTGGTLTAHPAQGTLQMDRIDAEPEVLFTTTPRHKFLDAELSHFLDCIATGERPLTDGARSLQSLRIIWRLYEAERSGLGYADLVGLGLEQV
ncbi:Gfo/Idh/MocA family protein [Microlunatus sp. Y2014]|uniref:Gfo/Idh/MocA family protein n=1 Tax=Microlunatus sp. Y2014 TaxID=3418488 RepID=UPI003DA74A07